MCTAFSEAITVTPLAHTHDMSGDRAEKAMSKHTKQLRLVEPPEPPRRRAKVTKVSKARRAHWASDWHLDAGTRQAGRAGVEAARAALAQARRSETDLPRAS
jgi:hypothetical protein